MRLAAAEVGLQLHDRVPTVTRKPLQGICEEFLQAFCYESAPKEFNRIFIFVRSLAQVDLPQIGGELGLLITARSNIRVWSHDLAPRAQAGCRFAFHRNARFLTLLSPELFIELYAKDLGFHQFDGLDLLRRYRRQQAGNAVNRAIRVIG